MDNARVIMLVDLDYFFAQCEERENPSYKDKPVVICVYTRDEESGAVSTSNYIARKFGVKSGIPIRLARRLLKGRDAVFLPVNHELYGRISQEIMSILRAHSDRFEQVSIDEAYLDVSERVGRDFESAEELAKTIKDKVLSKEKLTCSVGVGPNKLAAKIAAEYKKPNGLTFVKPTEVIGFLSPLPVDKLPGVGVKTNKVMAELGIKTIGDLADQNLEHLINVFGKALGTYFHSAARGLDESPVEERGRAQQISRITTLKKDTRDLNSIFETLNSLSKDVHKTIFEERLFYRSISVTAVMENFKVYSKSKTLEAPTQDFETIKAISKELLESLLREQFPLKIRRIGVRLSSLEEASGQKNLTEFLAPV
ncbi:MAG: hypothetical protein QG670_1158 [Thermoproteota archaeon]|nr:hypothetical protein [Thermoproteota archaeon]